MFTDPTAVSLDSIADVLRLSDAALRRTIEMFKLVQAFAQLDENDQIQLIKGICNITYLYVVQHIFEIGSSSEIMVVRFLPMYNDDLQMWSVILLCVCVCVCVCV
jgi:hypothetical protein